MRFTRHPETLIIFGADEVTTTIDAPAEVLQKIAAGGELFP
jgi:hypothetical protein